MFIEQSSESILTPCVGKRATRRRQSENVTKNIQSQDERRGSGYCADQSGRGRIFDFGGLHAQLKELHDRVMLIEGDLSEEQIEAKLVGETARVSCPLLASA